VFRTYFIGRDQIHKVLGGMIDAKTQLHSRVVKAATLGDIAQLYTDFEGTTLDASGRAVATQHKAIEVLRGQPEGDWKLIIGDPNGCEDVKTAFPRKPWG
jgi:ketosteroid isomerase-like protein